MVESKKNKLSTWLEELNISKVDIIIYSVSLVVFITLIIIFILISNSLQSKIKERQNKARRYEKALTLKSEADKIKLDYSNLPQMCEDLLNKFVSPNEVADFMEYIKTTATRCKAREISTSPSPMISSEEKTFLIPDEVADFFVEKGVFKESDFIFTEKGKNIKVVFVKQPLRLDMDITLGNLLAFFYCLENSSKYIDVSSLNISGGGESESVRVSMTINSYQLPKMLVNAINAILSETPINVLKNNIKKVIDKPDLADEQLKKEIKEILTSDKSIETQQLKDKINKVLADTTLVSVALKNKIKEVLYEPTSDGKIKMLKPYPVVSVVREKRVFKEEIIKYDNDIVQKVRPVFSTPAPPPPELPPHPPMKVSAVVKNVVAFNVDGVEGAFFGKEGEGPIRNMKKEPIPSYPNLKVKKIDNERGVVILDNNGVTSDVPFKVVK
jgi:hypothetical protein